MRILVRTPAKVSCSAHRISLHLPIWLFRLPFVSTAASRAIARNSSMELDISKVIGTLREYVRNNGHFNLVEVQGSDGEVVIITV